PKDAAPATNGRFRLLSEGSGGRPAPRVRRRAPASPRMFVPAWGNSHGVLRQRATSSPRPHARRETARVSRPAADAPLRLPPPRSTAPAILPSVGSAATGSETCDTGRSTRPPPLATAAPTDPIPPLLRRLSRFRRTTSRPVWSAG